jgi:hypothetical protein
MTDRIEQLVIQIKQLADEANALLLGGDDSGGHYPRIVTIDGAAVELHAPINPDWIPSMETRELTRYGSFGSEPSNGGRFGQPLRSPAGYPLNYVPDGMGSYRAVQVVYDGVAFPDDAAVEAFKAAVAARGKYK